jgi:hypothetical protein
MEKVKTKRTKPFFSSSSSSLAKKSKHSSSSSRPQFGASSSSRSSSPGGYTAEGVVNRKRMVASKPATERVASSARGGISRQKSSKTASVTSSVSRLTNSYKDLQTSVKSLQAESLRLVRACVCVRACACAAQQQYRIAPPRSLSRDLLYYHFLTRNLCRF